MTRGEQVPTGTERRPNESGFLCSEQAAACGHREQSRTQACAGCFVRSLASGLGGGSGIRALCVDSHGEGGQRPDP